MQMSSQNTMICYVENEKIMQVDYTGRPVKELGVTTGQYQEALKVIQGYKNKLVEAGLLPKERTPQEIQEETNALIKSLLDKVNNLENKVAQNELKLSDTHSAGQTEPAAKKSV